MSMPSSAPLAGYGDHRAPAADQVAGSPSLPGRAEFGLDHYGYVDGQRMRLGATRTLRPGDGESGAAFRRRVDELARQLLLCGTLEMDEEIRGGVVVQATIRLRIAPEPAPILDDHRRAGGRPAGPRGSRGGS